MEKSSEKPTISRSFYLVWSLEESEKNQSPTILCFSKLLFLAVVVAIASGLPIGQQDCLNHNLNVQPQFFWCCNPTPPGSNNNVCANFDNGSVHVGSCYGQNGCQNAGANQGIARIGEQSCQSNNVCTNAGAGGDADIGLDCCKSGDRACFNFGQNGIAFTGNHSCHGLSACEEFGSSGGASVASNSCKDGDKACFRAGSLAGLVNPPVVFPEATIWDCSCLGFEACHSAGNGGRAFITNDSCLGEQACKFAGFGNGDASIGDDSCEGKWSCFSAGAQNGFSEIGFKACQGFGACLNIGFTKIGKVGDESCVGNGACAKNGDFARRFGWGDAEVGKKSCLGDEACVESQNKIGDCSCRAKRACAVIQAEIGSNSCNCENCCRCLRFDDVIPNDSCNQLGDCCDVNDFRVRLADKIAALNNNRRKLLIDDPLPTLTCPPIIAGNNTGGGGDPHFNTWNEEHYEYHGQCDLAMVKDPEFANGLGLDIHIRTKLVRFWSYIKTVAIKIGDDILEIEGSADADDDNTARYWINFEYQGDLENLAGFSVTQTHPYLYKRSYTIDLSPTYPGQSITVQSYKEFLRVKFTNPSANAFGNSVGMLGDFATGKTLGRDGVTVIDDFGMLGDEWQVIPTDGKIFRELAHPQFPEPCIKPEDPRGARKRRLAESEITEEEAEAVCAGLGDPFLIQDCVYDVLATQDLGMIGAF